jgi:hypothetical protein
MVDQIMVRQLIILIVIIIGRWSSSYGQENATAKQDSVQQALENPRDESDSTVNLIGGKWILFSAILLLVH